MHSRYQSPTRAPTCPQVPCVSPVTIQSHFKHARSAAPVSVHHRHRHRCVSLARHRRGSQRRGPAPHHICANVWLWRCGTNGTAAPATAGLRPTPSSAPHYSRTAPPHPQSAPPWHCRNANGGAAATSVLERRHAWLLWGYNWLSEATQQAGQAVFVVCSLRIVIRFRFGH